MIYDFRRKRGVILSSKKWDTLFKNLTAGAGSKRCEMYFSVHGPVNRCNLADFLLFLHVNGKNPFHIALKQRHPLAFGTVYSEYRLSKNRKFMQIFKKRTYPDDKMLVFKVITRKNMHFRQSKLKII